MTIRSQAVAPYRVNVNANDTDDLTTAIEQDVSGASNAVAAPVNMLGLGKVCISAAFANVPELADLHLVYLARNDANPPVLIPVGVLRFPAVSPVAGAMRESAVGSYFSDTIEAPACGADAVEVRVTDLTGCVDQLRVWPAAS